MKKNLLICGYDRNQIASGIVHIGVGNFHRAHQSYYTHQLLSDPSQMKWGICGLNLLLDDERIVKGLRKQDNLYTLTVCGRMGVDEVYQIGSLVELIWAIEEAEAALMKLADPNIKIISCTITEGGYNVNRFTDTFNFENDLIQFDLTIPAVPKTVFGFVAEGLRRRMKNGAGPVTFLSCDNLQHNGNTAKMVFSSFIQAQDKNLATWVEENVTFPNSMVDRITPATTPDDVKRLNKKNGTNDEVPVYCEDFIQWVIEDKFIAGRPAWEKVGVVFTDDVATYENMKLSLLNASHTILSYPSFLCGYRKVDEAMHDDRFAKLLLNYMDIDITPYVQSPANTDLELYKQTLIERFGNQSVSDQISRLCADGASKYPVYVMPNLISMIRDRAEMKRVAFSIASYRHYLKYKTNDKGVTFDINDPWLTDVDIKLIKSNDSVDFLGLTPFRSANLKKADSFVQAYVQMVNGLKRKGVLSLLESVIE